MVETPKIDFLTTRVTSLQLQTKFVTKEFQEHCARLALGRSSAPSSAPCDTRIPARPSSSTASRVSVAIGTDPIHGPSRPTTAPPRHLSQAATDKENPNTSGNVKTSQNNTDIKDNMQIDSGVINLERSATTVIDKNKQTHIDGKSAQNEARASETDTDQQNDSVLEDGYKPRFDKVAKPKLVNQGIGMPGLQREFTMVEMPISLKTQDNVKFEREKTSVIDRADQKIKQSEKNVVARRSRLDTLIEQTVELVQDALDLEDGQAPTPSEFSSTIDLKAKARPVRRTRSEDTRERTGRVENPRQRSVKSNDPRQPAVRGDLGPEHHKRKVDEFREKLRQHTKRRIEKQQQIDRRTKRPVRRMVWNQNIGQPYKDDLQERMKKERRSRRDVRQSSAPPIVIPDPSTQERSDLQRSKDPRMANDLSSIKEQAKLRRSYSERNEDSRHSSSKSYRHRREETMHEWDPKEARNLELVKEQARVHRSRSLNRDRNDDSRHSSTKSNRYRREETMHELDPKEVCNLKLVKEEAKVRRSQSLNRDSRHNSSKSERSRQQEYKDSRIGSSKSVASHYSQDSDKSRPLVMLVEGDDPSAYRHVKLDMSKNSRSMDIANSIDFSGKASKLRGSPYLQYNPLVMGQPRKQQSASLNRSQHR